MLQKNVKYLKALAFTVTAGLLIFLSISGALRPINDFAARRVVMPLFSGSRRLAENSFGRVFGRGELRRLREENRKLLAESAELAALREENDALRGALNLSGDTGRDVVPVKHAGFFRTLGNEILVIDRGSEAGIFPGAPVITGEKIYAGRVLSSRKGQAEVILPSSSSQSLEVSLVNSKIRAIARGGGSGELVVELVPENVPVERGELLIVAASAGDPASGLLLGQVREAESGASRVFQGIRAAHLFNPFRAGALFVIVGE